MTIVKLLLFLYLILLKGLAMAEENKDNIEIEKKLIELLISMRSYIRAKRQRKSPYLIKQLKYIDNMICLSKLQSSMKKS